MDDDLQTISTLRLTALSALAELRDMSPHDQLAPILTPFHQRKVQDCLRLLDRDAVSLPDREGRNAALTAAEEIRARATQGVSSGWPWGFLR
jgi:hypothetical protein